MLDGFVVESLLVATSVVDVCQSRGVVDQPIHVNLVF